MNQSLSYLEQVAEPSSPAMQPATRPSHETQPHGPATQHTHTHVAATLRIHEAPANKPSGTLPQVVVSLASKTRSHTPYRQTKLTHLLKDAIGGNSRTLLIANVQCEVVFEVDIF